MDSHTSSRQTPPSSLAGPPPPIQPPPGFNHSSNNSIPNNIGSHMPTPGGPALSDYAAYDPPHNRHHYTPFQQRHSHPGTSSSSTLSAYRDFLDKCNNMESERQLVIAALLADIERLQKMCSEQQLDIDAEKSARRQLQEELRLSMVQMSQVKQNSEVSPFVSVVLDGDGAVFRDNFYALGKQGGEEAARLLRDEILGYLQIIFPNSNVSGWNIFVHVVLSAEGLGKKLYSVGIAPRGQSDVSAFGASFNASAPLFSFLDVGLGKEMADNKVRELLRATVRVPQCKHVIFGPCHDAGYAPFLRQYNHDAEVGVKITLLETLPPHQAFADLGFRRVRFDKVFRDENLPSLPFSKSTTVMGPPPPPRNPPSALFDAPISSSSVIQSASASSSAPPSASTILHSPIASISPVSARAVPSSITRTPPPPTTPEPTPAEAAAAWTTVGTAKPRFSITAAKKIINISSWPKPTPKKHILVNRYDERVDAPLAAKDLVAERKLQDRIDAGGKRCNRFHIFGICEVVDCGYVHGERLPPAEAMALRARARAARCLRAGGCRDVVCFAGHVCRYTLAGGFCTASRCQFSHTHDMDVKPVKRIYEDGSEEMI